MVAKDDIGDVCDSGGCGVGVLKALMFRDVHTSWHARSRVHRVYKTCVFYCAVHRCVECGDVRAACADGSPMAVAQVLNLDACSALATPKCGEVSRHV